MRKPERIDVHIISIVVLWVASAIALLLLAGCSDSPAPPKGAVAHLTSAEDELTEIATWIQEIQSDLVVCDGDVRPYDRIANETGTKLQEAGEALGNHKAAELLVSKAGAAVVSLIDGLDPFAEPGTCWDPPKLLPLQGDISTAAGDITAALIALGETAAR